MASIRALRRVASVVCLLVTAGAAPAPASAQSSGKAPGFNYLSQTWTEKDGLPGSGLWVVTQDLEGYLWLGTNAGLVRFDGVRFVHWNSIEPDLPSSAVAAIRPGRDGGLWLGFGGTGGIAILRQGSLEHTGAVGDRPVGTVASILDDRDGVLWAGGPAGAVRRKDGRWERMTGLLATAIYQFFEDRDGRLLVATSEGVALVLPDGTSRLLRPMAEGARGLTQDREGRLWVTATGGALMPLDAGGEPAHHLGDVDGVSLLTDRRGNLWVATSGSGLWVAPAGSPTRGALRRFDREAVSHPVIRALWEDREGNVWVGTQHGLTRLTPANLAWSPQGVDRDDQPVRAVIADEQDALWVSGGEAFYRLTGGGTRAAAAVLRGADAVTALHTDARGRLWIASGRGGLSYLEGTSTVAVVKTGTTGPIAAITSDRAGEIWVSDLEVGVYRLVGRNLELMDLRPEVEREPAIVLYRDRRQRVWVGFTDGVIASYSAGTMTAYDVPGRAPGIPPGRAYSIYEDSNGRIWVGTNAGLLVLQNDKFVAIALDYQQTGSYVVGVTEDLDGHLWLACSQGIVRIARDQLDRVAAEPSRVAEHTLYDISDGISGRPAWLNGTPTVTRTTNGLLWFVTSNGLAAVDPSQWRRARAVPQVLIESLLADGRITPVHDGTALPPRTSRLQIDYTALSFSAPQKVTFRYRLDGFDTNWVDAGVRRQAFYTNLPPGEYRFLVESGLDGQWGLTPAVWAFSVRPTYYQTTWFSILVACIAALFVVGALQFRARHARERFKLILAERLRVSREIHDTLLQDLIGVTLQFDALESEIGSAAVVRERFQALRRQLKHSIRAAHQSIRDLRAPVPKLDLIAALRRIVSETIPPHGNVSAIVELTGVARTLPAKQEEELVRIAQEAVINAVRHAQATRVRVELRYEPSEVCVTIVDNGRGFDPQVAEFNAHDHWGLASMQERAERCAAQFWLSTKPGEGTMIKVSVAAPVPTSEMPS